ncbi:MAG: hypothetical protein HKP17_02490 [Ignavibacteriaceae bacterium]|nr:hypothetical protein [Ignavibacteria bacterium]MBT8393041.1 hypothetical protein [Ignavibacteria bacterium]NNJ52012.1 hypothetical protein [Ignavibacteriaceae bacterium]
MDENKIEKQTFTYPLLFKLLFKYGNAVASLFLVIYSVPLVIHLDQNNLLIIPVVISLLLLYFINRHYLNIYKILPFKVDADNEKLVCTNFFLSNKEVIINYDDIESLSGGIFENKISGVMKVCDGRNAICIGFYQRLTNANKLATIILSKVRKPLYDDVLDKLTAKQKKN